MNPYRELDVAHDADLDTIKKAYRVKAHKNHPDKGGNPEKFHAIQKAYDILSDAERRKRYDERGEDGTGPDPRQVALSTIATLLLQIADSVDVDHTDIHKLIVQNVQQQREALKRKRVEHGKKIAKLRKVEKRVKKKTAGVNMLVHFIAAQIAQHMQALEDIARQEKTGDDIMEILAEYEYEFESGAPKEVVGFLGLGTRLG